jgi:hypothetical protein
MENDVSCYCSNCPPSGARMAIRSCRKHLEQDERELSARLAPASSGHSVTVELLQDCIAKTRKSLLQKETVDKADQSRHPVDRASEEPDPIPSGMFTASINDS